MIPLFLGLTAFNLLCLITTTCMGYALAGSGHASSTHLMLGVMTTMACIGVHCVVFTYFIATAKYRFADPFFRSTRQIHFRRIDMRHAQIESLTQRIDGGFAAVFPAIPGSLPNDCNFPLC